jgi:hypothetical protein
MQLYSVRWSRLDNRMEYILETDSKNYIEEVLHEDSKTKREPDDCTG